jgi:hypothetical protein
MIIYYNIYIMSSNQDVIDRINTILNNKDKIICMLVDIKLKKSFQNFIDQLENANKTLDQNKCLPNDLIIALNKLNI